jgi:hypothetical protein
MLPRAALFSVLLEPAIEGCPRDIQQCSRLFDTAISLIQSLLNLLHIKRFQGARDRCSRSWKRGSGSVQSEE